MAGGRAVRGGILLAIVAGLPPAPRRPRIAPAPSRPRSIHARIDAGPPPSLAVPAVVAVPGSFAGPDQRLHVRDARGRPVASAVWDPPFAGRGGPGDPAAPWRVLRFLVPPGRGGKQDFWIRADPAQAGPAAGPAGFPAAPGEGRSGPLRIRVSPMGTRAILTVGTGEGSRDPGGLASPAGGSPAGTFAIGIEAFHRLDATRPPRPASIRQVIRDTRRHDLGWIRLHAESDEPGSGGFTIVLDLQAWAPAAVLEGVVRVVRRGAAGTAGGVGIRVSIPGRRPVRGGASQGVAWLLVPNGGGAGGSASRCLWLAGRDLDRFAPKSLREEDSTLVLDLWPQEHRWVEGEAERLEILAGWGPSPSAAAPPASMLRSAAHWTSRGLVACSSAADLRRLGVALAPARATGPLTSRYDRAVARLRGHVRHHGKPPAPGDTGDWFDASGRPGNNEFDTPWGLLLQGLREEDAGLLHEAEVALHHTWTEDMPHGTGDGGAHGLPWMEGRRHASGLQELGHVWLEGGLLWGYLAGDREAFEVSASLGSAILAAWNRARDREPDRERCLGWPLLALSRLGAVTPSAGYRNAATSLADLARRLQAQDGFFRIEPWPLVVQAGDLGPGSPPGSSPPADPIPSASPEGSLGGERGFRMTTWVTSGVLLDAMAVAASTRRDPLLEESVVRGAVFLARHAPDPSSGRYARALHVSGRDGEVTRVGEVRGAAGMLLALGFTRAAGITGRADLRRPARRSAELALDDILQGTSDRSAGRELSLLLRSAPVVLGFLEGEAAAVPARGSFP